MTKIFKGVPYSGTLPATLMGTKAGELHRYKVYGNVGENLLEIEPEMLNETNWTLRPAATATYFMYYQLGAATAERLKKSGNIAGTVYLVAGGTYYNGEVLAITSSMKPSGVTTGERLLQNDGTPLQYAADVAEYENIYLCIGYGPGITSSNKQTLINEMFDNFDIMLAKGSTAPDQYIPYTECGERTENLFNLNRAPSDTWTMDTAYYINGGIADAKTVNPSLVTISINGNELTVSSPSASSRGAGFIVPVKPSTDYTISCNTNGTVGDTESVIVVGFLSQGETITRYDAARGSNPTKTITTDNNEYYLYFVFRKMSGTLTYSNIILTEGSTTSYIPYGYKLPLQSGSTPVDIYIGDDTLSDSEYVDSGTGKIYRMVSGVLTPVDPPVPFPAIPTSADSTTIGWAGEALAPSQFDSIAEWVNATPKIYHNGAWVDAQTYTYTNGAWVADN